MYTSFPLEAPLASDSARELLEDIAPFSLLLLTPKDPEINAQIILQPTPNSISPYVIRHRSPNSPQVWGVAEAIAMLGSYEGEILVFS